jgi:hypothetical protein
MRICLAWSWLSLLAIAVTAQTAPEGQSGTPVQRLHPVGPSSFTSLGFGYGPAGTLISAKKNAPFSAAVNSQVEQTLSDGTTIRRENQETVMRDSAGRVYRERALSMRPHAENDSSRMINIIDTVQHVQYMCSTLRKVCTKMTYRTPPNFRRASLSGPPRKDVTVEDLGPSQISGVEVEGQRVMRTLPEGMLGNDRPITTTEETWYSKALDVNVQMKRTDPRMGILSTTMTTVNPGEPDPRYFQIPEGYRVEERKFPNGMVPAAGGSGFVEVPKAQ